MITACMNILQRWSNTTAEFNQCSYGQAPKPNAMSDGGVPFFRLHMSMRHKVEYRFWV
ncbi:hypothetical protein PRECH8_19690 [Insulibacter thermoxylanivorax]|uniref:Uncharacterized protein n=1 Tax=Insulibacter thermoxylanivorax TaxID=2749268 RepID=A0A916QGN5_9BACL|nr:hypothetical protein PRECH8_19690 [Insulibacter thermoxylanivorax]